MKKVFMLATAALLVTGVTFAQDPSKKKAKGKKSCCANGSHCTKGEKKTASM
jgi:hypothetical protein